MFYSLFGLVTKDLEGRFLKFIDPSPYFNVLQAIKSKEIGNNQSKLNDSSIERDRLNANKSDGPPKKANFSVGRGLLKNLVSKNEVNKKRETPIWKEKSSVTDEQVEDYDLVYDLYIKSMKNTQSSAKKNNSNKKESPKLQSKNENNDVVYFKDSFLAKDYVPYVPFDGFIPNRRDESENEGKVLRFKWTEKLERELEVG
jgi:hypothetical protein